jgi:hypothetical protein
MKLILIQTQINDYLVEHNLLCIYPILTREFLLKTKKYYLTKPT